MTRCYFVVVAVIAAIAIFQGNKHTVRAEYADSCTTPDGKQGQCMPYLSCANIERRLLAANTGAEPLTPEYSEFLRASNCGEFDGTRHLCCAQDQIQPHSKVMSMFKDETFNCGSIYNKLVANGKEVQISSRPWMALLRYRRDGEKEFLCGGTLISNRYVLTAAHCVYKYEEDLFEVRLGEHKISTVRDCKQQGRKEKCAPPVQDIGIEKHILHEKYNNRWVHNDIALLRLNRSVPFEKHIKPICLPITEDLKQQAETLTELFVTGWGTTENGSSSDVLLQAKIPLQRREVCSKAYRREVLQTQICVGGADFQDSCKGDSGGPLQAVASYLDQYRLRMVEFGIVSLGVNSCGQVSLPGLYTNVAEYVQWITDKMAANGL